MTENHEVIPCGVTDTWVFRPSDNCTRFAVPAKWRVTACSTSWSVTVMACHICAATIMEDHRTGDPERVFTFEVLR